VPAKEKHGQGHQQADFREDPSFYRLLFTVIPRLSLHRLDRRISCGLETVAVDVVP